MMGAFLGYKLALLALFVAVILGGFVALGLLSTGIRQQHAARFGVPRRQQPPLGLLGERIAGAAYQAGDAGLLL